MSGLGLNVGGYGSVQTATAAVPSAAQQPGAPTVMQKAFGVGTAQDSAGSPWAARGTLVLGAAAAGLLVFLWHSLPR
jgi:hypothetical protein